MTAMKTPLLRSFLLPVMLATVAAVAALGAENLGAVKQRMDQRVPAIDTLKQRGAVGENNQGLLEARGALAAGEAAGVAAENADRQAVYAALAAQTGSTADAVGRKRAARIAAASTPGVWLQDEAGRWYRK